LIEKTQPQGRNCWRIRLAFFRSSVPLDPTIELSLSFV